MKILTILERGALSFILLGIVVAPWLFGAAEPWAYLSVISVIDVGILLWLVSLLIRRSEAIKLPVGWLPLFLLFMVIGFQLIPLPEAVVGFISGQSAKIHREAQQVFDASLSSRHTGERVQPVGRATVSVSPFKTRRALFLYVTYIGAYIALLNMISTRERLLRIVGVLVALAFALAVFAVLQYFTGTREIYWFKSPQSTGNIFGPYTNRNHCAAYINMALGPCLALVGYYYARQTSTRRGVRRRSHRRTGEAGKTMLFGFIACMMGAAVFLSLSRGAIVSMFAALGITACWVVGMLGRGRRGILIMSVGVVFSAVVWMGWEPVLERMGTLGEVARDPVNDARTLATLCTLRVFGSFPVWGCGFGSFEHAFPLYQEPALQFGRWRHAHNDWAQLLAEGGLIAFSLFVWALIAMVRRVCRAYRRSPQKDKFFIIGIGVSLLSIAIHSFIDYSLHRPANALMFVLVITLLMAFLAVPKKGTGLPPEALAHALRVSTAARVVIVLLIMLFLWVINLQRGELEGEAAAARLMQTFDAALSLEHNEDRAWVVKEAYREMTAVKEGRVDPYTLVDIARATIRWVPLRHLDPASRLRMADDAMRNTAVAACYAPSDYEYWLWLARMKMLFGERDGAMLCMAYAERIAPPGYAVAISVDKQ